MTTSKTIKTTTKATKKCCCGCGASTKGGDFRMGHDAKLQSRLISIHGSDKVLAIVSKGGVLAALAKLGLRAKKTEARS